MKSAIESGAGKSIGPRRRVIDARVLEKATGRPAPGTASSWRKEGRGYVYDVSSAFPEAMWRSAPC